MASEQTNTNEAIVQAVSETTKATMQAMAVAGTERTHNLGPRLIEPSMKEPTFNREVEDKNNELKNFRLEVNNIFKSYSMQQAEQIAITKNWLGRKGLQFLESLTQMQQERCNRTEGLFTILNNKSKPQYNETLKSIQFQNVDSQTNGKAEEWMGRLILAAVECNYKEKYRQLKEQFIHGLNDNDMLAEIIRELTKAMESAAVTSEQVIIWAKRVEAQRPQSAMITSKSETKEYDKIKTIKGG